MKKSLLLAALLLGGCASGPKVGNVIPGESGVYQVVTTGESEDAALSSALFSAKSECEPRHLRLVVIDQQQEYKGLMSEGANNAINKVAEIVGATTFKYVPTLSGADDYRLTMRFKCET